MRCSWEGQHPLHKVKRLFSLARWWMWCVWRSIAPFSVLFALISSSLVFSLILLPFWLIFLLLSCSATIPLSVTLFLSFSPICWLCLSHRIYCNWLYLCLHLPPSFPSSLSPCLPLHSGSAVASQPKLKVTCWLGQGLQHRTWVLPLLPARVLCCSQWSCLYVILSAHRWWTEVPEQMDLPTVDLMTLLLIPSVVFKIDILSCLTVWRQ